MDNRNTILLLENLTKLLESEIEKTSQMRPHSYLSSDLKDVIGYESNLRNPRGILEYVISLCPSKPKLLDFGCGNLPHKNLYEELNLEWIGLDYSDSLDPTTLTRKLSKPEKKVVEYAGKEIPFENDEFHIIWSNQSLEHIQDIEITFQEISRILKPQGFFAGSVSFLEPYHARSTFSYTPYGFKLICKKYGLIVKRILPGVSGLTLTLKRLFMILGLDDTAERWKDAFSKNGILTEIIEKTMYSKGYSDFDVASLLLQVCGHFKFIAIKENKS